MSIELYPLGPMPKSMTFYTCDAGEDGRFNFAAAFNCKCEEKSAGIQGRHVLCISEYPVVATYLKSVHFMLLSDCVLLFIFVEIDYWAGFRNSAVTLLNIKLL